MQYSAEGHSCSRCNCCLLKEWKWDFLNLISLEARVSVYFTYTQYRWLYAYSQFKCDVCVFLCLIYRTGEQS